MRIWHFLLVLLALAGCSTVESRIKERPEVFQSLPERQKTLVSRGEVAEGMTSDAIFLAWGRPDDVVQGSERGKATEEWVYTATRSETVTDFQSTPYFYGRRGRYHTIWDSYIVPVTITQEYPYKSVRFENGRVVAWRRMPVR